MNSIDKVKCEKRIANDIHPQLIAMWKQLRGGWIPPSHISEQEYNDVRLNKEKYPDYYVGYVGFHAVFGAKYFGGYARGFKADGVTPRDITNEAFRNTMAQIDKIKDIEFVCKDYKDLDIHNAVIYCDPPYENTTKYSSNCIDYNEFWQWCRDKSKDNIVFISSYQAPDDFKCIWEKQYSTCLDSKRGNSDKKNRVEKLFTY